MSGYYVARVKFFGNRLLAFLNTMPAAVPEIVLAVAGVYAWNRLPLKFYGTPWALWIAYSAACLPFAYNNIAGLLKNMPIDIEEMAAVEGAGRFQIFTRILLPQLRAGMKTGFILTMLFILREIPISLLLHTPKTATIGVLLYNLRSDTGGIELLPSISVLILLITFFGQFLSGKLNKLSGHLKPRVLGSFGHRNPMIEAHNLKKPLKSY